MCAKFPGPTDWASASVRWAMHLQQEEWLDELCHCPTKCRCEFSTWWMGPHLVVDQMINEVWTVCTTWISKCVYSCTLARFAAHRPGCVGRMAWSWETFHFFSLMHSKVLQKLEYNVATKLYDKKKANNGLCQAEIYFQKTPSPGAPF